MQLKNRLMAGAAAVGMVAMMAGTDHGRVARPFGFALTDPGVRLSRTRLLLKVTRVMPVAASMIE